MTCTKTLFLLFKLTCVFYDGREVAAGHSNDDEDDQGPHDQTQGP